MGLINTSLPPLLALVEFIATLKRLCPLMLSVTSVVHFWPMMVWNSTTTICKITRRLLICMNIADVFSLLHFPFLLLSGQIIIFLFSLLGSPFFFLGFGVDDFDMRSPYASVTLLFLLFSPITRFVWFTIILSISLWDILNLITSTNFSIFCFKIL